MAAESIIRTSPKKLDAAGENVIVASLNEDELYNSDNKDHQGPHRQTEIAGCPQNLVDIFSSILDTIGLEFHPFLVGWYNEKVGEKFHLNYPDDALAFVIISGPDVFEKCIVPYVQSRILEDSNFISKDPLDDSMKHVFSILKEDLGMTGFAVDKFHDFDLHPSRRPKVLVQTAAHVAGAVQYLHKSVLSEEIQRSKFSEKSNLSGVAIHPKYGGWYAIRGVFIFPNLSLSKESIKLLQKPKPLEIFTNEDTIARVVELFAYKWQTNEWRDMHIGLGIKYSKDFQEYLDTQPDHRWNFVRARCLLSSDSSENANEPQE